MFTVKKCSNCGDHEHYKDWCLKCNDPSDLILELGEDIAKLSERLESPMLRKKPDMVVWFHSSADVKLVGIPR